jgi:hypothetical protein
MSSTNPFDPHMALYWHSASPRSNTATQDQIGDIGYMEMLIQSHYIIDLL